MPHSYARASPGKSALPVTRNRRYAGGEANGRGLNRILAHRFYCETPSCGDGVGTEVLWKEGFRALTVDTGLGPEGSKPTADSPRSWGSGAEASLWTPGLWKGQPPEAGPRLY